MVESDLNSYFQSNAVFNQNSTDHYYIKELVTKTNDVYSFKILSFLTSTTHKSVFQNKNKIKKMKDFREINLFQNQKIDIHCL